MRLTGIGAIVVIMIAGPIYAYTHPLPSAVALTDGLTDKNGQGSAMFDGNVRAKFPIGTSVDSLRGELTRQGFVMTSAAEPSGNSLSFVRHEWNYVCSWDFHIDAQLHRGGQLTSIQGRLGDRKCLI